MSHGTPPAQTVSGRRRLVVIWCLVVLLTEEYFAGVRRIRSSRGAAGRELAGPGAAGLAHASRGPVQPGGALQGQRVRGGQRLGHWVQSGARWCLQTERCYTDWVLDCCPPCTGGRGRHCWRRWAGRVGPGTRTGPEWRPGKVWRPARPTPVRSRARPAAAAASEDSEPRAPLQGQSLNTTVTVMK